MIFTQPMLAASKIPPVRDLTYPLYASPKLDGIRCVTIDGVPHTYSRTHKRFNVVPNKSIQHKLSVLNLPELDGELMCSGNFNTVQSAVMSAHGEPEFTYNVFDAPCMYLPFKERFSALTNFVKLANSPLVNLVEHVLIKDSHELSVYWNTCVTNGYEGVIVRSINGRYKNGRSTLKEGYMLKLKHRFESEAVITGCLELMHNTDTATKQKSNLYGGNMLGALVVAWNGVTFKIGSGFDTETRIKLWNKRAGLAGRKITFTYQEISQYGVPRFQTFKAFREGY